MTPYLWQTGEPDPDDEFYGVVRTDRGGPFIARWGDCYGDGEVTWHDGENADEAVEGVLVWAMLPDLADFIDGEPPVGELVLIRVVRRRGPVTMYIDRRNADGYDYADFAVDDDDEEPGAVVTGWHPLPKEPA